MEHLQTHKIEEIVCVNNGGEYIGNTCSATFKSSSSMLNHIEMGGCQSTQDLVIAAMATQDQIIAAMATQVVDYTSCMHRWAQQRYQQQQRWSEHLLFDSDDTPLFCRGCDREFGVLSSLFEHTENSPRRSSHASLSRVTCGTCSVTCSSEEQLVIHKSRVHFICPTCDVDHTSLDRLVVIGHGRSMNTTARGAIPVTARNFSSITNARQRS